MSNSNSTTQHQFTQHIVCEYKTVAVPTSENVIVVVVVVALTCMQFHIGITQHLFKLETFVAWYSFTLFVSLFRKI